MINEILKKLYNRDFEFKTAFNHSSYANQNGLESNEKLEFLGDSIIGYFVSLHLFGKNADEGMLSKLRAKIVSTKNFARICDEVGLDKKLKIVGEISEKIKANLLEAVVAEVYLNLKNKNDIDRLIKFLILDDFDENKFQDSKTALQERLQKGDFKIEYKTVPIKDGFQCSVFNVGKKLGTGKGKNKKIAEQNAASDALKNLDKKG